MKRLPLLALCALAPAAQAAPPKFGPFGSARHPVTHEVAHASSAAALQTPPETFLRLSYDFYRTVLTPIDGARCQHRPTCSRYALLAVREHGPAGMLLAMDRLLRGPESSAIRLLRSKIENRQVQYLDPLEESTFWFTQSP